MISPKRVDLASLNSHLVCVLCGGYFVEATTIVECLHTFCRSCIVKYVHVNQFCPICDVQLHQTKPWGSLRLDKTIQDIVYKLVPGLYQDEMNRRRDFYSRMRGNPDVEDGEERGSLSQGSRFYSQDDSISLSLEYYTGCEEEEDDQNLESYRKFLKDKPRRYLQCPAAVTVRHLKKFLRMKYGIGVESWVDILYNDESLPEDFSLIDVAYTFTWRRTSPMRFSYRIFSKVTIKAIGPEIDVQTSTVEEENTKTKQQPSLEQQQKQSEYLGNLDLNPTNAKLCKNQTQSKSKSIGETLVRNTYKQNPCGDKPINNSNKQNSVKEKKVQSSHKQSQTVCRGILKNGTDFYNIKSSKSGWKNNKSKSSSSSSNSNNNNNNNNSSVKNNNTTNEKKSKRDDSYNKTVTIFEDDKIYHPNDDSSSSSRITMEQKGSSKSSTDDSVESLDEPKSLQKSNNDLNCLEEETVDSFTARKLLRNKHRFGEKKEKRFEEVRGEKRRRSSSCVESYAEDTKRNSVKRRKSVAADEYSPRRVSVTKISKNFPELRTDDEESNENLKSEALRKVFVTKEKPEGSSKKEKDVDGWRKKRKKSKHHDGESKRRKSEDEPTSPSVMTFASDPLKLKVKLNQSKPVIETVKEEPAKLKKKEIEKKEQIHEVTSRHLEKVDSKNEKEDKEKGERNENRDKIERREGREKADKKESREKVERKESREKASKKEDRDKGSQKETAEKGDKKEERDNVDKKESREKIDKKETRDKVDKKEDKDKVDKSEEKEKGSKKENKEKTDKKEDKDKVDKKESQDKVDRKESREKSDKNEDSGKVDKSESRESVDKTEDKNKTDKSEESKDKSDKNEDKEEEGKDRVDEKEDGEKEQQETKEKETTATETSVPVTTTAITIVSAATTTPSTATSTSSTTTSTNTSSITTNTTTTTTNTSSSSSSSSSSPPPPSSPSSSSDKERLLHLRQVRHRNSTKTSVTEIISAPPSLTISKVDSSEPPSVKTPVEESKPSLEIVLVNPTEKKKTEKKPEAQIKFVEPPDGDTPADIFEGVLDLSEKSSRTKDNPGGSNPESQLPSPNSSTSAESAEKSRKILEIAQSLVSRKMAPMLKDNQFNNPFEGPGDSSAAAAAAAMRNLKTLSDTAVNILMAAQNKNFGNKSETSNRPSPTSTSPTNTRNVAPSTTSTKPGKDCDNGSNLKIPTFPMNRERPIPPVPNLQEIYPRGRGRPKPLMSTPVSKPGQNQTVRHIPNPFAVLNRHSSQNQNALRSMFLANPEEESAANQASKQKQIPPLQSIRPNYPPPLLSDANRINYDSLVPKMWGFNGNHNNNNNNNNNSNHMRGYQNASDSNYRSMRNGDERYNPMRYNAPNPSMRRMEHMTRNIESVAAGLTARAASNAMVDAK